MYSPDSGIIDPWRAAAITTTTNSMVNLATVITILQFYDLWFYSQSRAACLDDALSVMANQFDDPPTIGVGETIQVPLEEDIADSIPAHSLLTDEEPIDMKPGSKHLLMVNKHYYIAIFGCTNYISTLCC